MGEAKRRRQTPGNHYGKSEAPEVSKKAFKHGIKSLRQAASADLDSACGGIMSLFTNADRGVSQDCYPLIADRFIETMTEEDFVPRVDFSLFVTRFGDLGQASIENAVKVLEIKAGSNRVEVCYQSPGGKNSLLTQAQSFQGNIRTRGRSIA